MAMKETDMASCVAGFEFASISAHHSSAHSNSGPSSEEDERPPHLIAGMSPDDIRAIHASDSRDLPGFAAWLSLYSAGKWDPSRPSPFGDEDPSTKSGSSNGTTPAPRSERSPSYSSSETVSSGPEQLMFKKEGWLPPPKPPNEEARQRALFRHAVLPDANPDGDFDKSFQRITKMAQKAFGVAACVILLVEKEHLPVLASVGFDAKIYERESSICGHTILRNTPHVILDTSKDWRLNTTHPYVRGSEPIMFYAGTQLRTKDGFNLGTLCLIDTKKHDKFDVDEEETLLDFGQLAMKEVELRMTKSHLSRIDKTSSALQMLTREVAEMGNLSAASDLPQVYDLAATCIRETLDIEGTALLDLSSFQLIKSTSSSLDGHRSSAYRWVTSDFVFSPSATQPAEAGSLPLLSLSERDPPIAIHPAPQDGFFSPTLVGDSVAEFLSMHPDGKLFGPQERPLWTGFPVPTNATFIYLAPILGPDQAPVALVVAYTCSPAQEFLEPECQFLQAVAGIVLSALLMRRVQEGDKIKAQFISNVSHELRTPLHGILASSELLSDTNLTPSQMANLRAIQTCSTSLSMTIHHVLDFSKTTAQSLSGRKESFKSITPTIINLSSFLEEAVAATFVAFQFSTQSRNVDQDIGGLYDPLSNSPQPSEESSPLKVQCLLDLQDRPGGWDVCLDAIGLRRILINLVGNAFKYTSSGYVKISLSGAVAGDDVVISVLDTGVGMSDEFVKTSCFQPFAQEDSISPGTGLGLAITSNLVRTLGGRISVTSVQGRGSEFTITLNLSRAGNPLAPQTTPSFPDIVVAFIGFDKSYKTLQLLRKLLRKQLERWRASIRRGLPEDGDILIVDESAPASTLTQYASHRALWVTSDRHFVSAEPSVQVLLKPVGPMQFATVLQSLVDATPSGKTAQRLRLKDEQVSGPSTPIVQSPSEETTLPSTPGPASSICRVLHVEDNNVNRSVLRTFFKKKGVPLDEAVNGKEGHEMFTKAFPGHYSIVLMDLSMPLVSGFESVEIIRAHERARQAVDPTFPRTPIFALTGSSSLEVQTRALDNGFDAFISKPVSLKDLWSQLKNHNYV